MAIQFPCPSCSQPIEVDDEYAGQAAACPYCRRVVNVPTESPGEMRPAAMARPTLSPAQGEVGAGPREAPPLGEVRPEAPPPPPPGGLHVGPTPFTRRHTAETYGNYSLVCAALVVVLFGAVFAYGLMTAPVIGAPGTTTQPDIRQLAEQFQNAPGAAWLSAGQCGMLFFAVVGVGFAIASLSKMMRGNWRGWIGLVVSGGALLVFCVLMAIAMVMFAGGAGFALTR
jgi:hypothetical protein